MVLGFTNGFDIGYRGSTSRQNTSENIPIKTGVGSKIEMWNKVMKEVKLGRFAGPYKQIPYQDYMQSPIGLVPKAGNQTRLIFHLSYDFSETDTSLNSNTPKDLCTVKYRDLDHAIVNCLKLLELIEDKDEDSDVNTQEQQHSGNKPRIFFSKTDAKSAFRVLPIRIDQRRWLLMMCKNALTGEKMYFVDKCLPFGASISCALFQKFSDALQFLCLR